MLLMRYLRDRKDLSQAEIRMMLGIRYYSYIERGELQPGSEEASKLEQFFGHPIKELLGEVLLMSKGEKEVAALFKCLRSIASTMREITDKWWPDEYKACNDSILKQLRAVHAQVKRQLRRLERKVWSEETL